MTGARFNHPLFNEALFNEGAPAPVIVRALGGPFMEKPLRPKPRRKPEEEMMVLMMVLDD